MPPQETKQKHPFNLSDEKAERLAAATLEFYHWFIEQPGGRESWKPARLNSASAV